MKKLLYVTGSRAEYGIMRRLLKKLDEDKNIQLDIVVTGMHLMKEYGETFKEVEKDFNVIEKIDIEIANSNNYDVLHSMSLAMEKFAKFFLNNKYDAVMLLGDRYEILPVAIASAINNIPLIHIHGGEKTLGNYDEFIRHSITKMSKLHLVATDEYRNRVIQLGENPETVKNVGSLGVANAMELELLSKKELENKLGNFSKPYFVVLFHPETITEISLEQQTENLISALNKFKDRYDFVFIGSNSDTGSDKIQKIIKNFVDKNNCKRFLSLKNYEYFSLLKNSQGLIGNSSSGIIEVPSLKIPTINIGNRQLGRVKGTTIIDCSADTEDILKAIEKSQSESYKKILNESVNPYYQENSLEKYYSEIKKFLDKDNNYLKDFWDIKI
nr:UDP-N-acetylglucosamine 2-epimerase [uncultured Fusobacterium sp.]